MTNEAFIPNCFPNEKGWYAFLLYSRADSIPSGGNNYKPIDTLDYYAPRISLNSDDSNINWVLKSTTINLPTTPSSSGSNTNIYASTSNKPDILLLTLSNTTFNFNSTRKETLLNYAFKFCGDLKCCCCPISSDFPSLIESKLRFVYA